MIRSALSAAGPGWQTWSRTATGYNQKQEQEDRTGLQTAPPDRNVGIPQVRSVRRCFLVEVPVCVTHADESRRIPHILEQEAALKRNACSRALCALEPAGPAHRASKTQLDFRISPRAGELRQQCAIPDAAAFTLRRGRPAPGQVAQSRARPTRMPAAMTA